MKSFRFRLQAVLTLREQAEHEAQLRFAQACAVVDNGEARLRSADAAVAASDEMRRTQLAAGSRACQLEQLRLYAVLLAERRTHIIRELTEARARAEGARRELLFATQRRESLERLRGRQRRAHNYQASRAEQKLLDELAGQGPTLSEVWRQAFNAP
jgi:flagellar export protein FliJ